MLHIYKYDYVSENWWFYKTMSHKEYDKLLPEDDYRAQLVELSYKAEIVDINKARTQESN